MTPQERQLIDQLFEKLARLEDSPRDADAMAAIAQGQRRAPNAAYALVQTVLVQDEALKRAHDRIQELERGGAPQEQSSGGFLDSMRDALFGQGGGSRGSVPNAGGRPQWNSGQVMGQPMGAPQQPIPQPMGQMGGQPFPQQQTGGGGGSFLGTAAAAAAGVVGGGMLLSSIRGMMGGGHQGFGDSAALGGDRSSPWSGGNSNNDLARDAGLNDIGGRGQDDQRAGFFDQASNTQDDSSDYGDDNDAGNDFGDDGDSDYA